MAVREAWRLWQPGRLLARGDHSRAAAAADRLERSWLRIFPAVRRAARVARGTALHLHGDLEGSLAALRPLHAEPLGPSLRYGVCSTDAASLVLLDRDLAKAADLLRTAAEARRGARPAEDGLLDALVRQRRGEVAEAERVFEEATAPTRAPPELRRFTEGIVHFLRGLYLLRAGKPDSARKALGIALRSPVDSVYSRRARALLEEPELSETEGPSSLAPQVVESSGHALEDDPQD